MQRILSPSGINGRLNELFRYAGKQDIPVYLLIDEYDNFANTILAHRGADAYHSFTNDGGFYRNFFATLKAGTSSGGLQGACSVRRPAKRTDQCRTAGELLDRLNHKGLAALQLLAVGIIRC